ncbi:alpha-E domain-containing protein [Methylococcus geothermalis]|uniref:Alpha-E domain-containing protein n=1 Tax=Methylococcus geothermalis TaxID=2681310 RepID=A0A858Q7C2_9GAMM|nr:alpha-E domain-containing protein [Methylococcus geothermalis]QJD29713.1 alpha-E domain-containing protein [Methylococcus geothermalis]
MAMLSRVAESLYWMSRYLERAENTARMINANANMMLDLPKDIRPSWNSLLTITDSETVFKALYPVPAESQITRFLISDARNPGSIISSLRAARENARSIRDILQREGWEQINELYLKATARVPDSESPKRRFAYLDEIILSVQGVAGLIAGTMSHDEAYEFVRLGCDLERADMTTRILDVRWGDLSPDAKESLKPFENLLWMSVLKSMTAYHMYRRHCQTAVGRDSVVKFLMEDTLFPRSCHYCLRDMQDALDHLPQGGRVRDKLAEAIGLLQDEESRRHAELHRFIDDLQIKLGEIHDTLCGCYFDGDKLSSQQMQRACCDT